MARHRRDNSTIDMWSEFTPPEVSVNIDAEIVKGGTLDVKIARALSHAMQQSGIDRAIIATQMSEYLDQNVTRNMLDTYASPARQDHKITLERFIALVAVTRCHDLLGFVAEFSDFAVVPKKYLDVIHYSEADEFAKRAIEHRDLMLVRIKSLGLRS